MRVGCACCTAYPHGLSLWCGFGFLDGARGAAAAVQAQELQGVLVEILVAGVKYGDLIFLLPVGQVKCPQLLLDGGVLALCLTEPHGNPFFAVIYINFQSSITLPSLL